MDFDVGPRQSKPQVNDRSFREMCRRIYEHPVSAEVGRADLDLARLAFIGHVQVAQMLNSLFSTSRD
jgi:hypothetical protein